MIEKDELGTVFYVNEKNECCTLFQLGFQVYGDAYYHDGKVFVYKYIDDQLYVVDLLT